MKTRLPVAVFVLGTRPEAIKLAPVIKTFKKSKSLLTKVIITGQHKEMVEQVMEIFDINSDLDLEIMKNNQTLSHITCATLNGLFDYFSSHLPQMVLVQGDTSTAFAASLASFYLQIPVAHIEAGLRTNDIYNPFPEEVNRRMISQLASLHFAPTDLSLKNLENSDVTGLIFKTGNTVIDALMLMAKNNREIEIEGINWKTHRVILATVHRRENWGENLVNIAKAFKSIADENFDTSLIIPLHKNSIVREPLKEILGDHPRIKLIEPLNYADLIETLKRCYLVLTDSGGIQEEAPSLGKPVLVLRDTTERPEAIKAGTAKIIGTKKSSIIKEVNKLLSNDESYSLMSKANNPFGDGKASQRILKYCQDFLQK